jgi:hypothetical protein
MNKTMPIARKIKPHNVWLSNINTAERTRETRQITVATVLKRKFIR